MIRVGKRMFCSIILLCMLCQSILQPVTGEAGTKVMRLNYTRKTIIVGDKFQLKLKKSAGSSGKHIWHSSNKKIATVSAKGKVTGKKAGKAKITVYYKGTSKKAVCCVTVKKKKNVAKPTEVPGETEKTSSPQQTGQGKLPSETITPSGTEAPGTAVSGTASPQPADSQSQPTEPAVSPQPEVTAAPVDSSVLVVSTNVIEQNGEIMTAYLINKQYYGDIAIDLNGSSYVKKTSGRNLLMLLATSATGENPEVNGSGTIRVSRTSTAEEYWTIEDLKSDKTYYLKADTKNTLDPSKADCGVIYVKGDVRSEVKIYTNKQ